MSASFFTLMFHGIVKKKPSHFLYEPSSNCFVRECDFETVIQHCKKKYKMLKLDDLTAYFDGTATQDGILITFDDGLESLCDLGIPILKKYEVPATVFITSEWTIKHLEPAIFALEYHLYNNTPALLNISGNDFLFEKKINTKEEIAIVMGEIWDELFAKKISPLSFTHEQIKLSGSSLAAFTRTDNAGSWQTVPWSELRKACEENIIEIGAHGKTHTPWTWLSNEQLENELAENRRQISEQLGLETRACSFPHGLYSKQSLEISGKHFEYGFANRIVSNGQVIEKFNISRYNVPYQRPNNIQWLIRYPFLGKVLRKFGKVTGTF
jgi:peptidoglycan/xylan/chitin deacetylase (PgdA/CDA1 family)